MIFHVRAGVRTTILAAVPLLAAVALAPFLTPLVARAEAAASTLSAPKITTGVGYAVDAPITLDSAPNGISGFEMTITLSDPNIATIDGAIISPEFGLTYVQQISNSEIKVMGADLHHVLDGSLSSLPLATLKLAFPGKLLFVIVQATSSQ